LLVEREEARNAERLEALRRGTGRPVERDQVLTEAVGATGPRSGVQRRRRRDRGVADRTSLAQLCPHHRRVFNKDSAALPALGAHNGLTGRLPWMPT
jgi:hypothetical protein